MSWGEKTCINYGYCNHKPTPARCNKQCYYYKCNDTEMHKDTVGSLRRKLAGMELERNVYKERCDQLQKMVDMIYKVLSHQVEERYK